ncbi:MAG TPA: hypothetical protein VMR52_11430 [Dehalococcoidia bacterium]|nr:hypothetical protein [Dehalococcoidia bacterium]
MDKRHMLESKVRKSLAEQLKQAEARLREIPLEVEMLELRLEMEGDLLSQTERGALERRIEDLRREEVQTRESVAVLPERIKLYRPLGRPEATFVIQR